MSSRVNKEPLGGNLGQLLLGRHCVEFSAIADIPSGASHVCRFEHTRAVGQL